MQKREKIIVGAAIIAALYGAVDLSLNSQRKKAVELPAQPDGQALTDLAGQLSALSSIESQKIASLAASLNEPWPGQLFVLGRAEFGGIEKIEESRGPELNALRAQAEQLIYSGFLAMGSERIAIVNGMDYQVGEQVNGFTITKIRPEAIQVSQQEAFFDIPASTEPDPALSDEQAP